MAAIRGVAFDMEGLIVNLEPYHHRAFVNAANSLGFKTDFENLLANVPYFIGGGDQAVSEGIAMISGGKFLASDLRAAKMHHFTLALLDVRIAPRPGFIHILKQIKKTELPVAVASLTDIDLAKFIFKKSGVNKLFTEELTLLRHDVEKIKPAPDVYLKAAHRMGILPSEMLVFEDSPTGIAAAKSAGAIIVAMPIYRSKEVLAQITVEGVKRIFFDWREINILNLLTNLREE